MKRQKIAIMWAIAHKDHGFYANNFGLTRKDAWKSAEIQTGNTRRSLRIHGDRAVKVRIVPVRKPKAQAPGGKNP